MSKDDEQRVFSVAPEGIASIEANQRNQQSSELPPIPPASSPDEVIFLTHILSLKTDLFLMIILGLAGLINYFYINKK